MKRLLNKREEEVTEVMKSLVPRSELDLRFRNNTEAIAAEVKGALTASHSEIVHVLNQKSYKVDVARAVKEKAKELMKHIEARACVKDVREALALKVGI